MHERLPGCIIGWIFGWIFEHGQVPDDGQERPEPRDAWGHQQNLHDRVSRRMEGRPGHEVRRPCVIHTVYFSRYCSRYCSLCTAHLTAYCTHRSAMIADSWIDWYKVENKQPLEQCSNISGNLCKFKRDPENTASIKRHSCRTPKIAGCLSEISQTNVSLIEYSIEYSYWLQSLELQRLEL